MMRFSYKCLGNFKNVKISFVIQGWVSSECDQLEMVPEGSHVKLDINAILSYDVANVCQEFVPRELISGT